MSRVTLCEIKNSVRLNSGPTFMFAAITSLIIIPAALIGYSTLYLPLSALTLAAFLKAQVTRYAVILNEGIETEKRANNAKTFLIAIILKVSVVILLPNAALSLALFLSPNLIGSQHLLHSATPDAILFSLLSTRSIAEFSDIQLILIAAANQALLSFIIFLAYARKPVLALCNACFQSPARFYDTKTPLKLQAGISREIIEATSGTLAIAARWLTTMCGAALIATYLSLWTNPPDAESLSLEGYTTGILVVIAASSLTLDLVCIARSCGKNYSLPTPPRIEGKLDA